MRSVTFLAAVAAVIFSNSVHAVTDAVCTPATPEQIEKVRDAFESKLLDARSARFQNVCVRKLPTIDSSKKEQPERLVDAYCGDINSKNRMGAYTGYDPFYWFDNKPGQPERLGIYNRSAKDTKRSDFLMMYCIYCTERTSEDCMCFSLAAVHGAKDIIAVSPKCRKYIKR